MACRWTMMLFSSRARRTVGRPNARKADPFAAAKYFLGTLVLATMVLLYAFVTIKLGALDQPSTSTTTRTSLQQKEEQERIRMEEFRAKMKERLEKGHVLEERGMSTVLSPEEVRRRKQSSKSIIPTRQRPDGGGMVHLGKTAGSTISVLLRNGCHSWMPHPCRSVQAESHASRLIQSYYHVPDFGLLPQSQHDFYLVTVRDPWERTVSAFLYEHALNRQARHDVEPDPYKRAVMEQAYQCFPTLENFTGYLAGDSHDFSYPHAKNEIVMQPCQDFARAAFHGRIRIFYHMYFGFRRIQQLIPDAEHQIILVTRQEHLWRDWKSVNRVLGQDEETVVVPQDDHIAQVRNITHLVLPVTRDLSPQGTEALCNALDEEYRAYLWFLTRAKNLNQDDVAESVRQAQVRCPRLWQT